MMDIATWITHLERAATRVARIEGQHDPQILDGAQDQDGDAIAAAFAAHGYPLAADLRALYALTLGIHNPISPTPGLTPPLPHGGQGGWSRHPLAPTVPDPARAGPSASTPHLVLGASSCALLALRPDGLFAILPAPGTPLSPQTGLNLPAAVATWAQALLLDWANHMAGNPLPAAALATRPPRDAWPADVQEAYTDLIAPLEPPPVRARLCAPDPEDTPPPAWEPPASWSDLSQEPTPASGTVVGLPYAAYPQVAGHIPLGARLRAHPVADNPHDPLAVEVWWDGTGGPARIGFLSRACAQQWRACAPHSPRLRVCAITPSALGVVLDG